MDLLKANRFEHLVRDPSGISRYSAWIESFDDHELRSAILAANVNVMRRHAPFACLFANGYTVEEWRGEDIGDRSRYLDTLEVRQIRHGIFPGAASQQRIMTTATAISFGDISPFVHLLDQEEFWLLCTCSQHSLVSIESILGNSESCEDACRRLLQDGGCILTIVDSVHLVLRTLNPIFGRYFQPLISK